MAGGTSEQQVLPMDTTEGDETNAEHKAFIALLNDLARELEHCATDAATYAYAADLITDSAYEKVFASDMRSKSDAFKVKYLIQSVRTKIKAAPSREDARRKMNEFLDCLRKEGVFDELVKSLGEVKCIGCYPSLIFCVCIVSCMTFHC